MSNPLRRLLAGPDEPPAWRSARGRRLAYAAAGAGYALIAGSSLAVVLTGARSGPGAATWLAGELVVGLAILLLPRFPVLSWGAAWISMLAGPLIGGLNRVDTGYYLIASVALVAAGLRYGAPRLGWMAVLTLVPVWLWTAPLLTGAGHGVFPLALAHAPDWTYPIRVTVVLAVLSALAYGAGRWRRDRVALDVQAGEVQRQAAEAQRQAADARQQRERGAVLEERARIAREMHDVVAHHMSMIAVQAETAPYRIAGLPEGAQAEFAALSQSAREALTDMRRLLGVLRSEQEPASTREPGSAQQPASAQALDLLPQPALADVDALVDSARRAGADVTLEISAAEVEVPPVVGLAAYRIVQESLSNAGRHAPGAPITVAVQQGRRLVRIQVDNGPACRPTSLAPEPAAGHGLTGMRERVALLGGQLSAGPRADGGFAVQAELPLRDRP
ncbi:MAG TPA: histidine kinase [Trebonia sp.]|nr:histidine kinase [Trebonia sp.]